MVLSSCPSDDDLRQLLAPSANSDVSARWEEHLSACESCQRRLEELAQGAKSAPKPSPVADSATSTAWLPAAGAAANESDSPALGKAMERLLAMDGTSPLPRPGTSGGSRPTLHGSRPLGPTIAPEELLAKIQQEHQFGPYEVQGILGQGGMGIVLAAHDSRLHRPVAIKLVKPSISDGLGARERFVREARAIASVKHPHIVTIYDVSIDEGWPYLVMEYVAGESLADWIGRVGRLPWSDVVRIGQEVASALDAAHRQGLVHRDIKPANILLEGPQRTVKVTDFGLARSPVDAAITATDTILGTPEYMSPEQAIGEPLDARSDLYSLGVVLYACCSGKSPFQATSLLGTLHRVRQSQFAPLSEAAPDTPPWLMEIIERLMSADPQRRPQTATELLSWLEERSAAEPRFAPTIAATASPATAQREELQGGLSVAQTVTPPAAHRGLASRWTWLAAVALLLALAVGLSLWWNISPERTLVESATPTTDHGSASPNLSSSAAVTTDASPNTSDNASTEVPADTFSGNSPDPSVSGDDSEVNATTDEVLTGVEDATTKGGPAAFTIEQSGAQFETLDQAIAAAQSGQTILINRRGPFMVAGIKTLGKSLTVRGTAAQRTVLIPEVVGDSATAPFWVSDADLTLENLEVRWVFRAGRIVTEEDLGRRAIVQIQGGALTVKNCRLRAGRQLNVLSVTQGHVVLNEVGLEAQSGCCLRWAPQGPYRCEVNQSVLSGAIVMSLNTVGPLQRGKPMEVTIRRSTLIGQRGVQFVQQQESLARFLIRSESTIWDNRYLTLMTTLRNFPRWNRVRTVEDTITVARLLFRWEGQNNVYANNIAFLTRAQARAVDPATDLMMKDVEGWKQLAQETNMRLGNISYVEGSPYAALHPGRIESIRVPGHGDLSKAELDSLGAKVTAP